MYQNYIQNMATQIHILFFILWQLLIMQSLIHQLPCIAAAVAGGKWELLNPNIGIVAMHMQLLHNDKVMIYDRTDFGPSNISLANGKCRYDANELALKYDCTAHSVEYDVASNSIRPLMVLTDIWCSSGAVTPDGTLIQAGGFNDGAHVVRVYSPNSAGSDWKEIGDGLINPRWYSTSQILPDGRQIIVGGRRQFNYEYYPKTTFDNKVFNLPFLAQTFDNPDENNLYPFVILNPDGNLFIFSNSKSILFDYTKNLVVKTYPQIPGGDPRCYPSTGSAVLLPLKNLQGPTTAAEVMVCGGAPKGSFLGARKGSFVWALNTCGRMWITSKNPQWFMETMPMARVMCDMLLLPNGNVLIINGASRGTAGWEFGRNPVQNPVIYRPDNPLKTRFEIQNPTLIPRMYHSTAILLRDGRVLVGGSNPHVSYKFTGVLFPTELRLEAFSPSYLDQEFEYIRPKIVSPLSQTSIQYNQRLIIRFKVTAGILQSTDTVRVTLIAPSFNTHSYSMNQRLMVLNKMQIKSIDKSTYQVDVITPTNGNLAPSGYYLLFVVHQDIPSQGIWLQLR